MGETPHTSARETEIPYRDQPRLIVVASEGLDVSTHCGMCTNYNYYRVQDGEICDSQNLPAKGAVDEHYAAIFSQFDVDVVIVSDISDKACRSFTERGITIARGATGRAIEAAQDFLDGNLDVIPADPLSAR